MSCFAVNMHIEACSDVITENAFIRMSKKSFHLNVKSKKMINGTMAKLFNKFLECLGTDLCKLQ